MVEVPTFPLPQWRARSPRSIARLGGSLYVFVILAGLFCETVARGTLVVGGDAMGTAAHLKASEGLWRSGIAIDLASCLCTVVLAWTMYELLRVVDRGLALLMLVVDAIAIGLQAGFDLNLVAALFPLADSAYLAAFRPEQLATMSYLAVRAHTFGFGICLLFFGFGFPIRGYLIARSGFLPRAIGVLLAVAGAGYLVNGFLLILAPVLAGKVFLFVALPILVGEGSLAFWLLSRGVDEAKWNAAAASR